MQEEVIDTQTDETINNLTLISKWGLDGSIANEYKQKLDSPADSDASVLMTSLVPIQLIHGKANSSVVLWKNPRPSSTRYCRPIRFCFQRETPTTIAQEKS